MIVARRPYMAKNWDGLVKQFFNELDNGVAQANYNHSPAANIVETEDAYHLSLLAPGRNKEQFSVQVDQDVLTVSYETKEAEAKEELKYVRQEFSLKNFKRSFTLDDKISAEGIQAKYENGVLILLLPKKAEIKQAARQIEIG